MEKSLFLPPLLAMNTCKTSITVLLQTVRPAEKPKSKTPCSYTCHLHNLLGSLRLFQFSATGNQQVKRSKCSYLLHPPSILFTVLLHSTSRVTNTWILTHDGERHNTRSFICTPLRTSITWWAPPFILYHVSH